MSEPMLPAFFPAIEPDEHAADALNGNPRGLCFAFIGTELLIVRSPGEMPQIPLWDQVRQWGLTAVRWQYLGLLNGDPAWSAELTKDQGVPAGAGLVGLRTLYDQLSEAEYALAGRAAQIVAWE